MRTQFGGLVDFILAFATRVHIFVEVRDLPLDLFGGPDRKSSGFIVTKRLVASQFKAIAAGSA